MRKRRRVGEGFVAKTVLIEGVPFMSGSLLSPGGTRLPVIGLRPLTKPGSGYIDNRFNSVALPSTTYCASRYRVRLR